VSDLFAAAADILDPPRRDELESPVNYAVARSRGRFGDYRHIRVIERAVLDTIAEGGRLIIAASVRHAKSHTVSKWTPPWYLGTYPDKRVILAGHEADFARSWGRAARDILVEHGPRDFGVKVNPHSDAANRWDLLDHDGGMVTIGVGGSPIGRGADLLIVDDPVKSFEKAMSPLERDRVWNWWTGTMVSRLEPGAAAILVMARWHEDDLAGRLLAGHDEEDEGPPWRLLRLPALCDDPVADPLGRELGEPLWPERLPRKVLLQRKAEVSRNRGEAVWDAQYQGSPKTPGGGLFPEDKWRFCRVDDLPADGVTWCRAWDLAASEDQGDWTVAAKVGRLPDGRFVITDVVRGQWDGFTVRTRMKGIAEADGWSVPIELPQDPGQAGKAQVQQLIAMLAGHSVRALPQTGSKETRAAGYAAQQKAGNVLLTEGTWNGPWVAEHGQFPRGTHDDQVDAGATGFNAVVADEGVGIRWM
jgi:predicted phage terminase large subunit-like protein